MRPIKHGAEGRNGQLTARRASICSRGRHRSAGYPNTIARVVRALLLPLVLVGSATAHDRAAAHGYPGPNRWGPRHRCYSSRGPRSTSANSPRGVPRRPDSSYVTPGNAALRILNVRTGCACTVATVDEVIPPGEVGYLSATLLTETLNGEVAQRISVMTNDPTSPETHLLIRGEIVTAVRILPNQPIVLTDQTSRDPVRRVIQRSVNSGHGMFNIVGLRSSVPWIDARARKVREPAPAVQDLPSVNPGDWLIEIRLDGQPTYGSRREHVEFKTGLERQPQVRLDVITEFAAPVRFAVDRLFLQPRGEQVGESLGVTVRQGLDPSALRVDARPEGLTAELVSGEGQAMTARVLWQGGRLDEGKLIFRIADEQVEIAVLYTPSGL